MLSLRSVYVCLSDYRSLVRREVTSPKGHWSEIYVECNDQVNIMILSHDICKR